MEFTTFTVNPFLENTYVVYEGKKALMFDPGFWGEEEKKRCNDFFETHELDLQAVVLTHAHVDHIMGIPFIRKNFDVSVYLNHTDLYLWENASDQAKMFGLSFEKPDFTPESLPGDKTVTIGNFTFKTLFTPGHSPDHLSFYFEDQQKLIAGDTLFKQGIGRTDLYKGDFSELSRSIKQKLYALPEKTEVLPGHGPATHIGFEKKNNSYIRV